MIRDLKHQILNGSIITKLMVFNIVIFAIQSILLLIFVVNGKRAIFEKLLTWFYFPVTFTSDYPKSFVQQPWSIITYQFLHKSDGILHIGLNMLGLYIFGKILIGFFNQKYVLPLYLAGGIAGALLYMATYYFSPYLPLHHTMLLGASASILAIIAAAATLVPNYTTFFMLIGPVKLKYFALFALLADIVSITAGSNTGGHIAHLGGALFGFFYMFSYQRGYNWFAWWPKLETGVMNLFVRKKTRVVYVNKKKVKPVAPAEKNPDLQKQTDALLDKITKSGYDSLTKSEKEFLFKISSDKE